MKTRKQIEARIKLVKRALVLDRQLQRAKNKYRSKVIVLAFSAKGSSKVLKVVPQKPEPTKITTATHFQELIKQLEWVLSE